MTTSSLKIEKNRIPRYVSVPLFFAAAALIADLLSLLLLGVLIGGEVHEGYRALRAGDLVGFLLGSIFWIGSVIFLPNAIRQLRLRKRGKREFYLTVYLLLGALVLALGAIALVVFFGKI